MGRQKTINAGVIFFIFITLFMEIVSYAVAYSGILVGAETKYRLIISQSLIFIPAVVFALIISSKESKLTGKSMGRCLAQLLHIKKTSPFMILIVPVVALSLIPFMTILNAISMIFVSNQISGISYQLVEENSYIVVLLLMAVTPAIVEECAYRGVVYGCFSKGKPLVAIIMSGLLFGIMHMNFNQIPYAAMLGIVFGFLIYATDSIFSTMLAHFCINGVSTTLSYLVFKFSLADFTAADTMLTKEAAIQVIKVYFPFAVVGLTIAIGLIIVLALLNHRLNEFIGLFKKTGPIMEDGKKVRICTIPLIIIIVFCLVACVLYALEIM